MIDGWRLRSSSQPSPLRNFRVEEDARVWGNATYGVYGWNVSVPFRSTVGAYRVTRLILSWSYMDVLTGQPAAGSVRYVLPEPGQPSNLLSLPANAFEQIGAGDSSEPVIVGAKIHAAIVYAGQAAWASTQYISVQFRDGEGDSVSRPLPGAPKGLWSEA